MTNDTIAAIGVFSVTLKDGTEVPVAVNEDTEEKQTEIKLNEPQLLRTEQNFLMNLSSKACKRK